MNNDSGVFEVTTSSPARRILCLDDDQDTRELVSFYLRLEGYEVVPAATVADALRLMKEESFDLYLLDDCLRDRSGIDLCRDVCTLDSSAPVIICSGDTRTVHQEAALRAGARAFVAKPTDPSELIRMVQSLVG